jgi:flagellar biosynthesis/type III secretory pathway protein FliH
MREDTAALSVVRPKELLVDPGALASLRDKAEREGRSDGYAKGIAEAQAEVLFAAEKTRCAQDSVLKALELAVTQACGVLETERDRLQHAAAELAFQIAEAVLVRELKLSSAPGLEAVRRALAESPESDGALVRLNPADAKEVAGQVPGNVTIVPDPSVGLGGCVLEVGAAVVDARIETALKRVRNVLDEALGNR